MPKYDIADIIYSSYYDKHALILDIMDGKYYAIRLEDGRYANDNFEKVDCDTIKVA